VSAGWSLAVVIPARNEELLIARCLESVLVAAAAARALPRRIPVDVVVVADSCTDATAEIARGFAGVTVLETGAANVGAARRLGVEAALAASAYPLDRLWLANTDADSVVPQHWLTEQARLARRGTELMLGTVQPEFADLTPEQRLAWAARHTPETTPGEVHGANLGLRADRYSVVGGFAPLAEHEDVDLVARCVAAGVVPLATRRCEVVTSGRQVGRTPGGYARYLSADLLTDPTP
jgi:glycosyltransferase involved in cell wall biosynthesis